MNIELKEKCDLFIKNREILSKTFKWDMDLMCMSAAALFTNKGVVADKEKLLACADLLKKETGMFSEFRGNVRVPVICKMILSGNPKEYFENVKKVQKMFDAMKWSTAEYKVLASLSICDRKDPSTYETYVNRTIEIYNRMKEEHKWLTSSEDIPFAAMLAVSDLDVDYLINDMEADFEILKKKFHDTNAVQSLTHVLSVGEESVEVKCERVIKIFDMLKAEKHKFATGYELATLGTLALTEMTESEIVNGVIEVDDYLKQHKGFGDFMLGADERRLYAAQMVLDAYGVSVGAIGDVVVSSMLSLTIAIEVCMMICVNSCIIANSTTN